MPSALIAKMIKVYEYPVIDDEDSHAEFIQSHQECVLFFTENPARYPESNDVAMILPELVKHYNNRFKVAVIGLNVQRKLQAHYGFSSWPSLVFLRGGLYLGAVSRVQNWSDYTQTIDEFLTREASPAPGYKLKKPTESTVS